MNPVYQQIDDSRPHACVLCLVGVPGKKNQTLAHHHIVARSELPGDGNYSLLWNPVNIAIACQYHHDKFGHIPYRGLWALAMIKQGYSHTSDYDAYPITKEEFDLGCALLGICLGQFKVGDALIVNAKLKSTDTIKSVWLGKVDDRIVSFCEQLCPKAIGCLQLSRENLYKEING